MAKIRLHRFAHGAVRPHDPASGTGEDAPAAGPAEGAAAGTADDTTPDTATDTADDKTAPAGESPKRPFWLRRLDLIIAVALGSAAIVGAFAAYKNEQRNHAATEHFSEAIREFDEAGQLTSSANTTLSRDQGLFVAYVSALHDKKPALANYIRDHVMDERLRAAVNWWQSSANMGQPVPAGTPFTGQDPQYVLPQTVQAEKSTADSRRDFAEAKVQQENADHYTLVEVILATALFLYGIAGVARSTPVKLGTLGTGGVIFIASLVLLITG